jgi:hypothetical protein
MNDPRAKPTLFVPIIGLPMLLLLGGGGVAAGLLESRTASDVKQLSSVEQLADRTLVPNGAYVEVQATVTKRGRFDLALEGADDVAVRIDREAPASAVDGGRVVGRVCDAERRSACGFSYSREDLFPQRRVLAIGMTPAHSREFIAKTYAVAVATVIVYLGLVVFSRRRRKGPARMVEEHAWSLPIEAEEIPARIRRLDGEDRFQIVEEGPGRLVFIQGYSENAARGWGMRKASVFPRRATVTWKSSPREATHVHVRIEEDFVWWPGALGGQMAKLAHESVASTGKQVEAALAAR